MSIDAVDLTSLDQFEAGFPHETFAERRRNPSGDLFSNVVHATIEEGGSHQQLSDEELHGFFNLLFAAGSGSLLAQQQAHGHANHADSLPPPAGM